MKVKTRRRLGSGISGLARAICWVISWLLTCTIFVLLIALISWVVIQPVRAMCIFLGVSLTAEILGYGASIIAFGVLVYRVTENWTYGRNWKGKYDAKASKG